MGSNGEFVGRRRCTACGIEEDQAVVVYPVRVRRGRLQARWCDWCRELRCWDCGNLNTKCLGSCTLISLPYAALVPAAS